MTLEELDKLEQKLLEIDNKPLSKEAFLDWVDLANDNLMILIAELRRSIRTVHGMQNGLQCGYMGNIGVKEETESNK